MKVTNVLFLVFSIGLFSISANAFDITKAVKKEKENSTKNYFLTEEQVQEANDLFEQFINRNQIVIEEAQRGDVVGNGGGLLEGQTYFYYQALQRFIASSFEQTIISFSESEKELLLKILNNVSKDTNEKKIIFIDGDTGFFNDEFDSEVRAAKTGFSPKFPIYINRTFLYENLLDDQSALITLLVHELGHQAGVRSHTLLESLGAKIKLLTTVNRDINSIELDEGTLLFSVYNHLSLGADADMSLTYLDNIQTIRGINYKTMKRICGNHMPAGFSVQNIYWSSRPTTVGQKEKIEIAGWLQINCIDSFGSFYNREADFSIQILIEEGELEYNLTINK